MAVVEGTSAFDNPTMTTAAAQAVNVPLSPQAAARLEAAVASGRFASVDEFITATLQEPTAARDEDAESEWDRFENIVRDRLSPEKRIAAIAMTTDELKADVRRITGRNA